ncbi:hypothetical protein MA16_Dca014718 [Dendrobium catenatum]|uniref:Transmembrane protein n=1 Tax=Dendrobium catenatum TaxID=906689 RepID=A0A2I0VIL2_9ASPA|nr:hypothetical protein MA16_Dca014718 [Dendrobium catenatum]
MRMESTTTEKETKGFVTGEVAAGGGGGGWRPFPYFLLSRLAVSGWSLLGFFLWGWGSLFFLSLRDWWFWLPDLGISVCFGWWWRLFFGGSLFCRFFGDVGLGYWCGRLRRPGSCEAIVICLVAGCWALALEFWQWGFGVSGWGCFCYAGGLQGDLGAWLGLGLFLLCWEFMSAEVFGLQVELPRVFPCDSLDFIF